MKMKTDYQIAQQNLDRLSQKSSLSYSISSSGFKKILPVKIKEELNVAQPSLNNIRLKNSSSDFYHENWLLETKVDLHLDDIWSAVSREFDTLARHMKDEDLFMHPILSKLL